MFRSLLCASLCASLSVTSSFAQSAQVGYVLAQVNERTTMKAVVKLSDLVKEARSKDPHSDSEFSAYCVGRAYETGEGLPLHRPDMTEAVKWYVFAAQKGSPNATYRLGQLMIEGNPAVPDPSSTIKATGETGASLERWAIEHGYSPATDTVKSRYRVDQERTARSARESTAVTAVPSRPSERPAATPSSTLTPDDATGPLVVLAGLAALLGLAAIVGNSNSTGGSAAATNDNDGLLKHCMVTEYHMENGYSVPRQVQKVGFECP